MNSKSAGSSGIGFFSVLGIVFVTLKLTGAIGWSWWWVLSPFWGPPIIVIFVVLLVATIADVRAK